MISDPRGAAHRPGPHDPILLWEAWHAARSPVTAWREHYRIPLSDPRLLDTDEETIVKDLLILAYRHDAIEMERNPHLALVGDPKALQIHEEKRQKFVKDEGERIERFLVLTGRKPQSSKVKEWVGSGSDPGTRKRWRVGDGESGKGGAQKTGKGGKMSKGGRHG